MLTHVVLFRLKDRSPENIARVRAQLETLGGAIPSLRGIEIGSDVLRSERSFDLALIARFDDMIGLQAYQNHPVHLPVLALIREAAEQTIAVDFES